MLLSIWGIGESTDLPSAPFCPHRPKLGTMVRFSAKSSAVVCSLPSEWLWKFCTIRKFLKVSTPKMQPQGPPHSVSWGDVMRRAALEDIWEGRPAPSAGMVVLRLSSVQHCLLCLWKMQIQAPSCPTKTSSQCVCKQTHWATFFQTQADWESGCCTDLFWQTSVLMISANKDISRRQFIRWNKSIWAGICSKKLCFSLKPQIKHRSLYKNKGSLKFGRWLKGRPSGWTKVTHLHECSPRKANCMENIKCNPKESLKILKRS